MSHVPCSVPVVSQSISFKEIASGVYFFALTLQWLKMLYTLRHWCGLLDDCDFLTAARDLYTNAVIPVAEPLEPSSYAGGGLVPGNSIHLEIRNHIYSPLKTLDGGVGGARQQTSLSASSMRFL
ncbi:hypothetical protein DTO280E4_6097 [Paecilomyces variotii]|nr:hypothetical protein DTO280E4_6097 [Paecilomyces variotii]KAJ9375249.1 hypothetical protein DTO282E5_233 [Paecilomyces variotii]